MRTHKVGTLTLGIALILFGVLFLVHLLTGTMSYQFIFKLWPIIFLMLGVEVLLSMIPGTRTQFQLSVGSMILLLVMMCFAMCMAGGEEFFRLMETHPGWF